MAFVRQPKNLLQLHVIDANGANATTEFWIDDTEDDPAAGAAAAIANGVQGITASYVYSAEILAHATQASAVTPTNGPYARRADKGEFVFYSADGADVIMQVPAPNETIFLPDTVNIDTADSAVAAFVSYVLTNCVNSEGSAIKGFQRGIRRQPSGLKNH